MKIRYDYSDVPTIQSFSESDAQVRALMGPFGSGKSSGCVVEMISRANDQYAGQDGIKRSRWAAIRNTYSQLEDTTLKTVMDWLPPEHFGTYNSSEHTYHVKGFDGVELEIMFRALDRPDHVKKLLSLELTGAWGNEARELPYVVIKSLLGRTGRYPAQKDGGCKWHGLILDTNPPDVDSWFYKLFEVDKPDNTAIFKQPGGLSHNAENLSNLIEGYYQSQYELNKGDPEWVKVYVNGEYGFVVDGLLVYPEYRDSIHCKEVNAVDGITIIRGWDFGLTPACEMAQQLPNGRVIAIDELISEDVSKYIIGVDAFSDALLDYCGKEYRGFNFVDVADPAGIKREDRDAKSCFDMLRSKGINVQPAQQSPKIRIESVKKPLRMLIDGEPGLIVSPKCKKLRKGFMGGYQYRRMLTRGEKYENKPDKNEYSHPHDAFQYLCSSLFSGSLEQKATMEKFSYEALYANY